MDKHEYRFDKPFERRLHVKLVDRAQNDPRLSFGAKLTYLATLLLVDERTGRISRTDLERGLDAMADGRISVRRIDRDWTIVRWEPERLN